LGEFPNEKTVCFCIRGTASVCGRDAFDYGSLGPWQETQPGNGIYGNTNNPDLRFDTNTGRKAVPGRAAAAQAENDADEKSVISRPESTLVDPHRTLD